MVAATPQDLGLYTQGNPSSAEAGVVAESRRDRRAIRQQNQFGVDLVRMAQMAVRFDNKGNLPAEYERLSADWNPVTMPTPSVTADAVTKEIASGSVPATSDVVLKRLGYSSVERSRLEQDRRRTEGREVARRLAESVNPPVEAEVEPDGDDSL
jgi:isochorismate hydrolase